MGYREKTSKQCTLLLMRLQAGMDFDRAWDKLGQASIRCAWSHDLRANCFTSDSTWTLDGYNNGCNRFSLWGVGKVKFGGGFYCGCLNGVYVRHWDGRLEILAASCCFYIISTCFYFQWHPFPMLPRGNQWLLHGYAGQIHAAQQALKRQNSTGIFSVSTIL